jgi:hypothetical protein
VVAAQEVDLVWVRDFGAVDFHDALRLSARQVIGHHRILVIRLADSTSAGLESIGAQNQVPTAHAETCPLFGVMP